MNTDLFGAPTLNLNMTRCLPGAAPLSIIMRQGEMEMYEQKDFSGSIWVNDRKDQDTHPDRTGSAKIDGVGYWVNGWLKKTKDGKPYLSLSFKKKIPEAADRSVPRQVQFNDEVCFAPEWR